MESLMIVFGMAAIGRFIFDVDNDSMPMDVLKQRNDFVSKPAVIVSEKSLGSRQSYQFNIIYSFQTKVFDKYGVTDKRVHKAFAYYSAELSKLFASNETQHFEMEPDYNAFCVCFGGKTGGNACAA